MAAKTPRTARARMTAGALAALSVAAAAGPWDGIRLSAPPVVRWAPGAPHTLPLSAVNGSVAPTTVPQPFERSTEVEVRSADDRRRLCAVGPSPAAAGPRLELQARPPLRLDRGEQRPFTVDLSRCSLTPGDYRFVARWRSGDRAAAPEDVPAQGLLVVEAPGQIPIPRIAVQPPTVPHTLPGQEAPPSTLRRPAPVPEPGDALQACVDEQLRRQGLDAWGDPPGTLYPQGPPGEDADRVARVLQRRPEIRTRCGVASRW